MGQGAARTSAAAAGLSLLPTLGVLILLAYPPIGLADYTRQDVVRVAMLFLLLQCVGWVPLAYRGALLGALRRRRWSTQPRG